jgi:hypothetical protein
MVNTTAVVPEEQHFFLSNLSPGRGQRRLALAVVLALLVAFFITAGPLSTIQLAQLYPFIPMYAVAFFVVDLITAVLLFAQFYILRLRALLVIAIGYLFTALIVIPWMLTFPGVRAERPAWRRDAECELALHSVACRFSHAGNHLRIVEG